MYLAYQNLYATGQCGILGSSYASITLSYDPSAISSYSGGFFGAEPTAINYADLATNCTTPAPNQSEPPFPNSYDMIHCSPLLTIPAGLQDLDPAWSTCVDSLEFDHPGTVIDPPKAIFAAPALAPSATEDPGPIRTPAPGSLASPSVPQKTTPPTQPKTGSGSDNGPSVGNDPPSGNQLPPDNDPSSADDPASEIAPPAANDPPSGKDAPTGKVSSSGDIPQAGDSPLANVPNGPLAGNGSAAEHDPPAGNDVPTGKDSSGGDNVKAGDSPPADDPNSPAAGNGSPAASDPPAQNGPPSEHSPPIENGLSTGNDPSTGKSLSDPSGELTGSLKVPQLDEPQASQIADSDPPTNDIPAVTPLPLTTTVAGHVIQAIPSSPGAILVDEQSVARGEGSTVVSGTLIALHSNGDLVLGTSTVQHFLPGLLPTPSSVFTIGTQPFTLISNNFVAGSQTIKANDPGVNIDGTIVSLGQSKLQIGTSTIDMTSAYSSPVAPVITAAGRLATLLSKGVAIAGAILTINAPAITAQGTPISLGPNGLVIGSSTIPLPSPPPKSIITIAGQPYTISQAPDGLLTLFSNGAAVAGATLTSNEPAITIAGTRISLGASGLVVGSSTIPPSSPPSTSSIVIAGQAYAILRIANGVIVAGKTLEMGGPAVTISGSGIALESAGLVVNGTSTIALQSVVETSASGSDIGGFVLAGLNGGPVPARNLSTAGGANGIEVSNNTGAAGALDVFRGRGARVEVRLVAVVEMAVMVLFTWFVF